MAIEQMESSEINLLEDVNSLSTEDAGMVGFKKTESLLWGGELDPNNVDISNAIETVDKANMKITFKENISIKEKDKTIMTLLARKNKELGNPLWGKTTNIIESSWRYYIDSSEWRIGIQNYEWLNFLKKFDFSVQSSLIGWVDKKNGKRTIAISNSSLSLVK